MSDRADVFVSCAETSGDMHAGGLVRALLRRRPGLVVEAVGGEHLRAAGAGVLHDSVTRATFGLRAFGRAFEVIRLLKRLRRRWRENGPPRLVVCCDSWTMNKHVLKLAREHGCRTMYYVSPQVWASREGRVRRMALLIDRLACILPFEEAWLRERGVNATFVGHPLFDELPDEPPTFDENERFPNRPPRIAFNFGSRLGTAKANLPPLLGVRKRIAEAFSDATFVTPTVPATDAFVREQVGEMFHVEQNGFDAVMTDVDLAITVSGTATLHTAAHGVPMLIVFRGPRLLWHLVGRHIVRTRVYGLVNLLHPERKVVAPEFIPWFGDPRPIAEKALELLKNPDLLAKQRRELARVVDPLRRKGAGDNAAAMALDLLDGQRET